MRRAGVIVTGIVGVGLLLATGCGSPYPEPTVSGAALFAEAKQVNKDFKTTIAEVQKHIDPSAAEWQAVEYGNVPLGCNDRTGYRFSAKRGTSFEWKLPSAPATFMNDLADWLTGQGWTVTDVSNGDPDLSYPVVEASNPTAGIASLSISLNTGKSFDDILLIAKSTCHPGDPSAIGDMQYPSPDTWALRGTHNPEWESPDAEPIFSFNERGYPLLDDGTVITPTPAPTPNPSPSPSPSPSASPSPSG